MKPLHYSVLLILFIFISTAINGQELEKKEGSNGKYGFVDTLGAWVIQPQYDNAYSFLEGLAAIKLNGKWGFIDKSGTHVVKPQFDIIYPFSEELAPVNLNDKWGFVNKSGVLVVNPQYDDVGKFVEGLAKVKLNDKWGYIDKSNTVVIKPQYDDIGPLYGDLAIIRLNGKRGIIDIAENVIIPITPNELTEYDLNSAINTAKQKSIAGEYDKIRQAIAVRTGYFSFSYYAQSYAFQRINKWQKKGEFEKTIEWQKRVNQQSRKQKSIDLTKQAEKEFLKIGSKIFQDHLDLTIGSYDADNEVYLFVSDLMGKLLVPVPIDKAQAFKNNWESYIIQPEYFIDNDQLALSELTFISKSDSSEQFKYSNNASLNYTVANVTYDFDDLELDLAKRGSRGIQSITSKSLRIGRSDVDMDIPTTTVINKNTFAVIISNENYQMVDPVVASLNDGEIFKEYCHKTLGLPRSNIRFYKDATYGNLIGAIGNIQDISEAYDGKLDVIFYYSGHGFPDENSRDAYLLPIDGSSSQMETSYPLSRLYSELSLTKAQHITVFLDACFSGSQRDGSMLASARGIALKPRMGVPAENMVVFSAASGDQTALAYMSKGHGLFTYYLLKKLKERKGNVTLQELGDYIITNVKQSSVVENKKLQTPTVNRVSTRHLVP